MIPSSGRDLDPCGYWQDLQMSQGCPRAPRREASRDTKGYQTKKGGGDAEEMWGGPETALSPQEVARWPLPVKRLRLPPTKPELSKEQAAVLRAVLKGQSIFFTGSAGSGGKEWAWGEQGCTGMEEKGP